ncbi:MAG TPA: hypothetical protein VK066_10070 [Chloroflexota bacterium]|nr:hypothetical protein [Chloroflexota bacterium]
MRTVDDPRARDAAHESDSGAPRPEAPPAAVGEGLGLTELVSVLEALGTSELAGVFEALGACEAVAVDRASAWLRARSREWLLRGEARRARLAAGSTDDPFGRMLLRREAEAAAQEHAAAERAFVAAEAALVAHLGPARAAVLQRALARLQDLTGASP